VTINILGEEVRFFHSNKSGVDRVFVDHPAFLSKVWPFAAMTFHARV
jgi:granule-bound starch synthase